MAWRLVGSWKPILQHVPYHISRILPGRKWRQISHIAGEYVPTGPGHPLCWRLAAIQRSRRLSEVGRQVMVQAFNWRGRVGGSASLSSSSSQICRLQTRLRIRKNLAIRLLMPNRADGIYDVTIARHQTLHSHPHACLAYINQAKQIFIAPYTQVDQMLVIVHTDHPPPAYHMPWLPAVISIIG